MKSNRFSQEISVFHGRATPELGKLAGYGALIRAFDLNVPIPDKLAIIASKHKRYSDNSWNIFTPRHAPTDDIVGHLTFALKYEGVDLYVLKAVFIKINSEEIERFIKAEPLSQYNRRIWFFYEWLLDKRLDLPNLKKGNYINALDEKFQYPGPSVNSTRHRIRNNMPGVKDFCPLIRKTTILDKYISEELDARVESSLLPAHKDILMRAAAFLLLKDSKASYAIEGESPPQNRLQRWGKAIGQAGKNDLSKEELLRLQTIVIENERFINMGWRTQGGFVGDHDRTYGTPIPDHISAKWQDVEILIEGLINTNTKLQNSDFDPVLAAALIAFGFVIIHPFVDGNGRIHRYLVHHILSKKGFAKENLIFPISAAILERLLDYRKVLEDYSIPRLDLIEWEFTPDNNVKVLNNTIDLYRYYDATKMAEFLYTCVEQTIDVIIPNEVEYLHKYDTFKYQVEQDIDMPDKTIALLLRFLEQNKGKLSKRAREKEFRMLEDNEVNNLEKLFSEVFETD